MEPGTGTAPADEGRDRKWQSLGQLRSQRLQKGLIKWPLRSCRIEINLQCAYTIELCYPHKAFDNIRTKGTGVGEAIPGFKANDCHYGEPGAGLSGCRRGMGTIWSPISRVSAR